MTDLQVIKQQEVLGKGFTVYGTIEEPLFLAKDVAEWIDYSWTNSKKTSRKTGQMLATVDDDEKFKATIQPLQCSTPSSHGGARENTEMWFLTEYGLYEVLMQSRKPIAKKFKKEVKRILKELRLTGQVAPAQHVPTAFEEMVLHNAKNSYNYNTYTATDLARCFGLSSQVINHFLLTTDVIKLGGHINQFGERVPYTEDGKYEKYVVGDKYKDEGLVLVEEFSTNVSLRLTLKGALFVYELLTTLGYEELRVADNVASYAISDIAKELGMKARELNAELLSKGFYELDDNGKKVINPRYNGYGLKAGTRLSPIARKEIMSLITTGESIFNDKGAIEYVESGRVPVLEGHPKMVSIYGTNPALRLLLN